MTNVFSWFPCRNHFNIYRCVESTENGSTSVKIGTADTIDDAKAIVQKLNFNRNRICNVMKLAWQFVKANGLSMAEAMKLAWKNIKLRTKMLTQTVSFKFKKKDGSVREAIGTLCSDSIPSYASNGNRKANENVQVYYDVVKQSFRSFIKANLLSVA